MLLNKFQSVTLPAHFSEICLRAVTALESVLLLPGNGALRRGEVQ
jgi:hypothetical protein